MTNDLLRRQPSRDKWGVELTAQESPDAKGIVTFEYVVKERTGEPFLLNSHDAQFRTNHQRIKTLDGGMLHVSGAIVSDLQDFFENDPRAYRWVDKDGAGNWRDDQGRTLPPYMFACAPWCGGELEELDPQWEREQYILPIQGQVDEAIQDFLNTAEKRSWVGDRRGTTLNRQVGAGADDAYEAADNTNFSSTANSVRADAHSALPFARYTSGFRFTNCTIAPADTVDDAKLQVYVPATNVDDPQVYLILDDVDDAVSFVTNADVETRGANGTTATAVPWSDTALGVGWEDTPDFKAHWQEVVDRAGWASGQAMVAMLRGRSDIISFFDSAAYEAGSANAAKLVLNHSGVTYTPSLVFGAHYSELPPRMDGAAGAPVHEAEIRTMYFDETANVMYVNNDGATGWTALN